MKKTNKIARLDAALGKQKLSKNEMRQVNGGIACYCNGHYCCDVGSVSACCTSCGTSC